MSSLSKRASQAAGQAISTGISAGVGVSSLFGGLTGQGNAADAEQASASSSGGGGLLSGVLDRVGQFFGGGESTETPGVEADPTFHGTHDVTEGVEDVEPEFVHTPTPYRRAVDAFAAGDSAELSAAYAEMKPGGRQALAKNRPDIFQALLDSGDSHAQAFELEQWERQTNTALSSALIMAEKTAIGVAEEAWLRYGDSRDGKWFASAREGRKVVVPPRSQVVELNGLAVNLQARGTGDITFVHRDERHGEVDTSAELSWTVTLRVAHEGLEQHRTMVFTTTGHVGEDSGGRSRSMDTPGDWSVQ